MDSSIGGAVVTGSIGKAVVIGRAGRIQRLVSHERICIRQKVFPYLRRFNYKVWNYVHERLVLACARLLREPALLVVECAIMKPVVEDVRKVSSECVDERNRAI